jgi:alpha-glucosidase
MEFAWRFRVPQWQSRSFLCQYSFSPLKRGSEALGILVHNPRAVFFSLNPDMRLHPSQEKVEGSSFYWGSTGGRAEIFFCTGKDVASVLRRYGRLVGTTPRPPLWSLGYHQCRWGYSGTKDLERLNREMTKAGIPCDGLWLDIDSMDRYKVFTTNPETFKNPESTMAKLLKKGRHVVAILDPGVRDEKSYSVRQSGIKQRLFARIPTVTFIVVLYGPEQRYSPISVQTKERIGGKIRSAPFLKKDFRVSGSI